MTGNGATEREKQKVALLIDSSTPLRLYNIHFPYALFFPLTLVCYLCYPHLHT